MNPKAGARIDYGCNLFVAAFVIPCFVVSLAVVPILMIWQMANGIIERAER